ALNNVLVDNSDSLLYVISEQFFRIKIPNPELDKTTSHPRSDIPKRKAELNSTPKLLVTK
ncbi:TPA: hypothetical protein ACGF2G_003645, partial [Vibrio cholerae]